MRLNKKEIILLMSIGCIFIILLFYNSFYRPIQKQIDSLSNEYDELDQKLQVLKDKQAQIETLNTLALEEEKKFSKIADDFMPVWDEPQLIYYIEQSLGKTCEKNSFVSLGVQAIDQYYTGDFGLGFNTDYEDFISLLEELESSKYYNTILSLNISLNPEETKQKLGITTNIRFYALENNQQYPEDYDFMQGRFSKKNLFQ